MKMRFRQPNCSSSLAPGSRPKAEATLVAEASEPIWAFVAPKVRAKGARKLVTKDSDALERRPSIQRSLRDVRAGVPASASSSGPAIILSTRSLIEGSRPGRGWDSHLPGMPVI